MKQSESTEVKCFRLSRKSKVALFFLGVFACALLKFNPLMAAPFFLLLFFIIHTIIYVPSVVLTLTKTGITDHRTPFGEIAWIDVRHIGTRMNGNLLVIAIGEFKWTLLLERVSRLKALIYELNLPGDIIFISDYSTDMKMKDLYALILEYADRAHGLSAEASEEANS